VARFFDSWAISPRKVARTLERKISAENKKTRKTAEKPPFEINRGRAVISFDDFSKEVAAL
jgi:hypothetical protein